MVYNTDCYNTRKEGKVQQHITNPINQIVWIIAIIIYIFNFQVDEIVYGQPQQNLHILENNCSDISPRPHFLQMSNL